MARATAPQSKFRSEIPLSVLILWILGGASFALIVYLFTPYTHNLDDIKVTLQYVLGSMVWGFFAVALWAGHIRRIHPFVVLSLFAFMLVMLASTILARFPWRAWRDLGFQLTIMAPFVAVVGTCTNERRFRNICLFYFLIACGTVAFGLFHYFGGIGFLLNVVFRDGPPRDRVSPLYTLLYTLRQNGDMLSTILNRDFYPAYLLMVAPLGIALMLYYRNWRAKVFFIIMFFLMSLCIILAISKDTYLALFLMTLFFIALCWGPHDRVTKWFLVLMFLLICVCIFLAFLTYWALALMALYLVVVLPLFVVVMWRAGWNWRAIPKNLKWGWIVAGVIFLCTVLWLNRDQLDREELRWTLGKMRWENLISIDSRKVIWGGGVNIFFDPDLPSPEFLKCIFLGAGGGSFYLSFPNYRHPNYHLYEISNVTLFAHNQYCDLLCEQGLLGLGLFLLFLGAVTWLVLREAWHKTQHPLNVYQIALATAILGISFQNFFSPAIRWTVCGFNYWFLLGLVVAGAHMTFSDEQLRRIERFYDFSPSLRRALAVSCLIFVLVFMAISIPYGLRRFNAAKNNNDGLIYLNEFSNLCTGLQDNPGNDRLQAAAEAFGHRTIQSFRTALAWKPSFITSHYKLAHTYSRMAWPVERDAAKKIEWWERAERTYQELAKYAPDYSEIHLNHGILGGAFYEATGDPRRMVTSLVEFHRAAEMSNKLNVQIYYARRLRLAARIAPISGSKNSSETLRLFLDCLDRIMPPEAHDETTERRLTQIGQAMRAGEYARAGVLLGDQFQNLEIRVCEHIVEQATWLTNDLKVSIDTGIEDNGLQIVAEAQATMADYYLARRQYAKALVALEALVREEPNPDPTVRWTNLRSYAGAAKESGEYRQCLDVLREMIARDPVDWRPREAARWLLDKAGDYERSLRQAEALLQIVQQEYRQNSELADPEKGPALRAREGGMPTLAEAYYNVGVEAQKIGDLNHLENAHKMYNKAIEMDPDGLWGKKALNGILEIEKIFEAAPAGATTPTLPGETRPPK